jgi:lysophospholipase L1-like esterase
MALSATRIFTLLALLLAAVVVIDAVILGVALWRGRQLALESRAFEARVPEAARRLLVIGDSTGVGTGASDPRYSVAGRISSRLPHLEIVNLSADGARMAAVQQQLQAAPQAVYDVVLIQAGGNDILRFTDLTRLRETTDRLLETASARAGLVVMMSTGDVGTAPAFPFPVDMLYSWQTRRVRGLLLDAAARHGITYIDLYDPGPDNPFISEPWEYHARDGLHPSDAGYRLWFEQLAANSTILERLDDDRQTPGG